MANNSEHLTHLVYEASLDNSLWPELIIELTEQMLRARSGELIGKETSENLSGLTGLFCHRPATRYTSIPIGGSWISFTSLQTFWGENGR